MVFKKPRFFCDNCSTEVPSDAAKCPGCGRYFASVRCPACSFSGEDALFKNGCPACGYSAPKAKVKNNIKMSQKKHVVEALPIWVYIVTAAALFTLLIALYRHFF